MHFLFVFNYAILKMVSKMRKSKDIISLNSIEFILIVVIGIILGIGFTLLFFKKTSVVYQRVDDGVKTIIDTYNYISDNYYTDINKDDLINGAVKGMLAATDDPYTTFMETGAYNNFNITLEGEYKGLGVEITKYGEELIIVGLIADSPAKKAGLELGDVILSVNGESTEKMSSTDLSRYIQENKNDDFELIIRRDNKEMKFSLKKEHITLKSVESKVIKEKDKKIGYIYVSVFASNTYEQFKEALNSLKEQEIDSLIIDLRDNSGGELSTVTNMISLFLDDTKVIYQIEDKTGDVEKKYSNGKENFDKPIVVLVNENTASASEVMTAALKDNLGATVVGEKTYGKGTVQVVLNISTGEQYKLTTKKWLTPNGDWINEKGIEPDIEVSIAGKTEDDQLTKAVKHIVESKKES